MDLVIVLYKGAVIGAVDVVGDGADLAGGAAGVAEQEIRKAVAAVLTAEGERTVEVGVGGLIILHVQHIAARADGVPALIERDHVAPIEVVHHVPDRVAGTVAQRFETRDADLGEALKAGVGSRAGDAVLRSPVRAGMVAQFDVGSARQAGAEFVDHGWSEHAGFGDSVERLAVVGSGAEGAQRAAGEGIIGRIPALEHAHRYAVLGA